MRIGFVVRGTVQGVGFRPFVRRIAIARALTGWVRNGRDGVRIEVQGDASALASFAEALEHDLPPPARIVELEREALPHGDDETFRIVASSGADATAPVLPPDLATCAACFSEVSRAGDRRYRYPFT